MNNKSNNLAIVGGGIIGLSIGWQLLRRGVPVTLYEKDEIGQHTSRVAAGMLAPYAEVGFEEVEIMELGQKSLQLYPRFLDELSEDSSSVPHLDRCGTLLVGIDRDDTEHLSRLYNFRKELNLKVEMMTGTEAREREPLLSPNVVSGVWLPDDGQIDNRQLLKSLKEAFLNRGGTLKENAKVTRVHAEHGTCTGITTEEKYIKHDSVVITAGPWTGDIETPASKLGIRPVKGQILTLQKTQECDPSTIIRSPRMYLVPKENGTLRLGATSEEQGFNTEITAGGMKELLEDGWEVVPSIYDLPIEEMIAGLRPSSRDHAPVIGESEIENLYYATGHFRNGILLTPVTVYNLINYILDRQPSQILHLCKPDRF
ncbi:MAG TPA: glycine oxidase ThiO [Balneolaceae bacterium]|nr:glycine oxidase ThiO [Balneolaceae bacterium]